MRQTFIRNPIYLCNGYLMGIFNISNNAPETLLLKKSHNARNAVIEFVKHNQKTYNGSVFTFFFLSFLLIEDTIVFLWKIC